MPQSLLLRFPTERLIAAIESTEPSEAQLEGAARLFGGWAFSQKRAGDLKKLSSALKARLLAHSLRSDNPDKIGRAKRAFGI